MRFIHLLSALVVPLAVSAGEHRNRFARRHHDLAVRDPHISFDDSKPDNGTELVKRQTFSNARFTFYDVGLGSCGSVNIPSDFIVAMNAAQMNPSWCGKSITISYNGKTTGAVVMDTCPGCPFGGLDMSFGLFTFFADQSMGVINGQWWANDGSGGGGNNNPPPSPSPSPSPSPTPSYTPPAVPSSIWSPPPPPPPSTSSWVPPPSSSSPPSRSSPPSSSSPPSTSSSPSYSNASSSASSSTPSTSATPTPSTTAASYNAARASGVAVPANVNLPSVDGNINEMYQVVIDLAVMVKTSHQQ